MEKRIALNSTTRIMLDDLIDRKAVVWACYPRLIENLEVGPTEECKFKVTKVMYKEIYPYEVVRTINHAIPTYSLRPMLVSDDRLVGVNKKFADGYETIYFIDVNGELLLRNDMCASTSYELVEEMRDIFVEYLKVEEKETIVSTAKPEPEEREFSLEEAKEALSQVYGIPTSKIKIKL